MPPLSNRAQALVRPSPTNGTKVTTRSMVPNPAKAQTPPRATNHVEVIRPTTAMDIAKVLPRHGLVVCPVVLQEPRTRSRLGEWKGQEVFEQFSFANAFAGCVTLVIR
jgi:hypothetical protein